MRHRVWLENETVITPVLPSDDKDDDEDDDETQRLLESGYKMRP